MLTLSAAWILLLVAVVVAALASAFVAVRSASRAQDAHEAAVVAHLNCERDLLDLEAAWVSMFQADLDPIHCPDVTEAIDKVAELHSSSRAVAAQSVASSYRRHVSGTGSDDG